MNRRSSSWTGRAPRDMQTAFGCYASRELHPMQEQTESGLGIALAIILGVLLALGAFNWLAL